MAGIKKSEMVVRRAARGAATVFGKDKLAECEAAARKVATFIGGLSDIGLSIYLDIHSPGDVTAISKQAKADREAARAARKASKAQSAEQAAA